MDVVKEAKYLLCGLPALIDEQQLNVIVCPTHDFLSFEKEKYEAYVHDRISVSRVNKTIFSNGAGGIIWKSEHDILRGYSAKVIIFIGIDKDSDAYKAFLPCIRWGNAKIYNLL